MAKDIMAQNFEAEVLSASEPVVVDFWAPWCGPCRMLLPIIDELSQTFEGKVKFVKVNVDDNGELAEKYRVMSVPTVFVFKNGQQQTRFLGLKSKEEITEIIQTARQTHE